MRSRRSRDSTHSGFSLIETILASTLLAVALTGLAQLFAISLQTMATARSRSTAMILAAQKMEQLRSLMWTYDAAGSPISDFNTDTTVSPEQPIRGTGLSPSPPDALWHATDGYVDYVDFSGNLLGGGRIAPRGTSYVRRWSIDMLSSNPNTLLLQVVVKRFSDASANQRGGEAMTAHASLVSIKTRKAK